MIPMPISHVAQRYAQRYCEWGLPPEAIAIAILELLTGPGVDDWDHTSAKEEQLAIGKALAEGRDGVRAIEEAASSDFYSNKIDLWKDICKRLGINPTLSTAECRYIYSKVLSGKIRSVADALESIQEFKQRLPDLSAPEGIISANGPPQPR